MSYYPIKHDTHSMEIIDERNGHALVEITKDGESQQYPKRFFVVATRDHQVFSAIPEDCPDSGLWVSNRTVGGVAYVANGRTRSTARRWFKRLTDEEEPTC